MCSWVAGLVLATMFQVAHCVDVADFTTPDAPRRGAEWAQHQLRTTVNVRCRLPVFGHAARWLMGGLDHQIEHHLAPGLPHTAFPSFAPRVQAFCAETGLTYREHPSVVAAVRSHGRWLRTMGRGPANASVSPGRCVDPPQRAEQFVDTHRLGEKGVGARSFG